MEIVRFTETETNNLIHDLYSIHIDSENISITRTKDQKGNIKYKLIYYIYKKGMPSPVIQNLTIKDYINLVKAALSLKGYKINHIEIKEERELIYKVYILDRPRSSEEMRR